MVFYWLGTCYARFNTRQYCWHPAPPPRKSFHVPLYSHAQKYLVKRHLQTDAPIPYFSIPNPSRHAHFVQALQRAQAQSQSLRSAPNTNEPCDRALVAFLFYAQIGQSILPYARLANHITPPHGEHTKYAPRVQICRQELTVPFH